MTGTRPVPFPGTEQERDANRMTHDFMGNFGEDFSDMRCIGCDAKPWHVAADYPCGTDVPRETY